MLWSSLQLQRNLVHHSSPTCQTLCSEVSRNGVVIRFLVFIVICVAAAAAAAAAAAGCRLPTQALLEPLQRTGVLVRRTSAELRGQLQHFTVIERETKVGLLVLQSRLCLC
jgi:hypothetical protein